MTVEVTVRKQEQFMSDSFVPPGYNHVSPYLAVADIQGSINFMLTVFDGELVEQIIRPDGSIGHSEVRIGCSLIMLGGRSGCESVGAAALYVYVADVDACYARAIAAGARSHMEPKDTFHGDRLSGVVDSNGTLWWIATNKERLSREEIQARATQHLKR